MNDSDSKQPDDRRPDDLQRDGPPDLDPIDLDPADLDPADLDPADLDPADLDPVDLEPVDVDPIDLELVEPERRSGEAADKLGSISLDEDDPVTVERKANDETGLGVNDFGPISLEAGDSESAELKPVDVSTPSLLPDPSPIVVEPNLDSDDETYDLASSDESAAPPATKAEAPPASAAAVSLVGDQAPIRIEPSNLDDDDPYGLVDVDAGGEDSRPKDLEADPLAQQYLADAESAGDTSPTIDLFADGGSGAPAASDFAPSDLAPGGLTPGALTPTDVSPADVSPAGRPSEDLAPEDLASLEDDEAVSRQDGAAVNLFDDSQEIPLAAAVIDRPVNNTSESVVVSPEKPDAAEATSVAKVLRVLRLGVVGLSLVIIGGLIAVWWWSAKQIATESPGYLFTQTAESEQARAAIKGVRDELAELERKHQAAVEAGSQHPDFPSTAKPTFTARGFDRLLFGSNANSQEVQRIPRQRVEEEKLVELARSAMESGRGNLNNLTLIVLHLDDAALTREFLDRLKTANDADRHFATTAANGLVDLLIRRTTGEDAKTLLPVVVELSGGMSVEAREQLKAYFEADRTRVVQVLSLAFHPNKAVQQLVRSQATSEELWNEAAKALQHSHARACVAAAWIAEQEAVAARRPQVIEAMMPQLWITLDNRTYPAMQAVLAWGGKEQASALAARCRNGMADALVIPVCLKLAEWSPEELAGLLKAMQADQKFNEGVARAARNNEVVGGAIKQALRDTTPQEAHALLLQAAVPHAAAEDVEWLEAYKRRLPEVELPRRSRVPVYVELLLNRAQAAAKGDTP